MKNENIANSTLHVVASEHVKAEEDMKHIQKHTISELINEEEEKDQNPKSGE